MQEQYPTLDEVKAAVAVHGPLVKLETSSWSIGMMYGSRTEDSQTLTCRPGSPATLVVSHRQELNGGTAVTYRVDEATAEAVRALVERENMAAWGALRERPIPPELRPTDVSGGSSLSLTFDGPNKYVSISRAAVWQQGGGPVLEELNALLLGCQTPENVVSTEQLPAGQAQGMLGLMSMMQSDQWLCSACGTMQNGGKYCRNCGAKRP